jgi:hypothetical protein
LLGEIGSFVSSKEAAVSIVASGIEGRRSLRVARRLALVLAPVGFFLVRAPAALASATLFVATTGANAGNCQTQSSPCKTISYALSQAGSGDTVDLAAGTYQERPLIAKSVSLVGADQFSTVIDGGGIGSAVTVLSTATTVNISNLAIQHGKAAFGGGIVTAAPSLTLSRVRVLNNVAASASAQGGGIYASAGTVTLDDASVFENQALGRPGVRGRPGFVGGDGGVADGGGIYAANANLVLKNQSDAFGNSANGGAGGEGGAVFSGAGGAGGNGGVADGGGIFATGPTGQNTLTITGSLVESNVARSGDGGAGGPSATGSGGLGGTPAIASHVLLYSSAGGGVLDLGDKLNVTDSTIAFNKASDGLAGQGGTGGGAGGNGGGSASGGCRAQGGGIWANSNPGGIQGQGNPGLAISSSVITSNQAMTCAGGQGGAGLPLSDQAGGNGGSGGNGGVADGGGAFLLGVSLSDSSVSNNSAAGGNGGPGGDGAVGGQLASGDGAHGGAGGTGGEGLHADGGGTFGIAVTTTRSLFSGNRAVGGFGGSGGTGGGGGSGASNHPGGAGGGGGNGGSAFTTTFGGGLADDSGSDAPTLLNSTVAFNAATGGNGGAGAAGGAGGSGTPSGPPGPSGMGGSGANAAGGGLSWNVLSSAALTNDTIVQNSATGGALGTGSPSGTAGTGSGGGLSPVGGVLSNSIVAKNSVKGSSPTGPDCTQNGGTVQTGGHNLIGAIDGCSGITNGVHGDQAGTSTSPLDPLLGSLADNGGPTDTMAEQPASPAIGKGSASVCTSAAINDEDQRGFARASSSRGACDIGAYDVG